jgi:hypothetical protein
MDLFWFPDGMWTKFWGDGSSADPVEPPPDPPVMANWQGLTATWTGYDGSRWDISDPGSGVFITDAGIRGLHMPEITPYASQSPLLHGSRFKGYRIEPRELFLPTFLYSDVSSADWLDRNEAFWRTMHPGQTGLLRITRPDGKSRGLVCRYRNSGDWADEKGAVAGGWALYPITVVAEQPLWMGEPDTRSWEQTPDLDIFPDDDTDDYVLYIASPAQLDTAKMSNPGDEPVRPIWSVYGPFDSVTVGVEGRTITVGPLDAGEARIIDTRPEFLAMYDKNGNEVTDELSEDSQFASIPPGEAVLLSLEMTGGDVGAYVEASVTPLYHRAY